MCLQPSDWDEEDDGEWEVPMIPNPAYKGPWKPKVSTVLHTLASHFTKIEVRGYCFIYVAGLFFWQGWSN
jgi:hypothetical protein